MPSWFETSRTLDRIRDFFNEKQVPAYIVGGYLRDRLLGRESLDLDIVVPQGAVDLARHLADRLGAGFFPLDQARDVGRVIINQGGRQYLVDISRMRGGSIAADLRERDFTINALAQDFSASEATLIDPFEGEKDLRERVLRVVAGDSFSRDPLRLLRAVRLAGELGFKIEPSTRERMMAQAHLIAEVSRERVRDEIFRLLALGNSAAHLRLLYRSGILNLALPQTPTDPLLIGHSLSAVEALERTLILEETPWPQMRDSLRQASSGERSREGLLKMIALLHHAILDPEHPPGPPATLVTIKEMLVGLALTRREMQDGARILWALPMAWEILEVREPTPLHLYRLFREAKGLGREALILALADEASSLLGKMLGEAWPEQQRLAGSIISLTFERQEWISPQPVLKSEELISALRLTPDRKFSRILEAIREAQVEGRVKSKEQALELAKSIVAEKTV